LLTRIAMEDGKVSLDETMIIANAMRIASTFDNTLAQAKQDGIIDEEERKQLNELRKRIFEVSADVAEKDDVVTKDETKLLNKILEIVDELKAGYDDDEE